MLYLSDVIADDALIVDWCYQGVGKQNPLSVLEELLAGRHVQLDTTFVDFAAQTMTFEAFACHEEIADAVDWYVNRFSEQNFRYMLEIFYPGTDWRPAPEETLPEHHAYNIIRYSDPQPGSLQKQTFKTDLPMS